MDSSHESIEGNPFSLAILDKPSPDKVDKNKEKDDIIPKVKKPEAKVHQTPQAPQRPINHSPPNVKPKQVEIRRDVWSRIAQLEHQLSEHQSSKLAALVRLHAELERRDNILQFVHVSLLRERNLYLKKLHTVEHYIRNKGIASFGKEDGDNLEQISKIEEILFGRQSSRTLQDPISRT